MLDLPALARFLDGHHHHDLFRLETLDRYRSASDGDDLDRFLHGEPEPDRAGKQAWLDKLRTDAVAGRRRRRVHVVTPPLSDYLRYECEWGYADNSAAGEEIRILDLSRAPDGADLLLRVGDFYLADDLHVATVDYDPNGQFLAAAVVEQPLVAAYVELAETAWRLAEPFEGWWNTHPEFHRATLDRERAHQG
ncbi:DUF6879 family protein [Pseudonocardia nigra]|uniref:DUF6879 family protein n=1 Tax=Pseudonocardia nigra TaxID=1921578 RepID=UPI001C5E9357|nr:DUF6879 family protein [Pseudonocardia nigra]